MASMIRGDKGNKKNHFCHTKAGYEITLTPFLQESMQRDSAHPGPSQPRDDEKGWCSRT